ncbi:MAG: tRNA pseudouridine(38-40) synthase TruA [Lachnospiraceae bacterium]|nr:tRNA pseudouridine(38-40) synthase TruA [Lachnospiraceae bacterium]
MEKNYLLCIEYDGSRYSGWQRQGNTDNTIEGKIGQCLKLMCGCNEVELRGAGRTDAGVHARGQIANVKLDTAMDVCEIKSYLNRYLPEDIRVKSVVVVDDGFHARFNAKKKIYSYSLDVGEKSDVFRRKYTWHLDDKLDISIMRQATDILLGQKDFRSFSDMKTKKSSVRTIYSIQITEESDIINIKFTGDGFLYHMVRKLSALLVEVGAGRIRPDQIQEILEKKDRQAFKLLAPGKGLCLEEVFY